MNHLFLAIPCILLIASCQVAPSGYHRLSQNDLTPHATSHLYFPVLVNDFDRGIAWEKDEDERHVRVVYERRVAADAHETLTVLNSSLALPLALETKMHFFVEGHPGATVSESASRAAQPYFPGWRTVVFDYDELVSVDPPGQPGKPRPLFQTYKVYQPRRILIAARTFHKQTVFLESSPLYDDWLVSFLPAASQFARNQFPH